MSDRAILIREISRVPANGLAEKIVFRQGVNVIVGPPNTGKSKWLRMLDYLFGDDGAPQEVFGEDLAEKYDSVWMTVHLNGEDLTVQREWKKPGVLTKVSVNGVSLTRDQYSELLMKKLGIPTVHYPQGSPYGSRTWPTLGWRSLFRHIYRRQEFWSDLADKQPFSEQHASMLQFLGLAQNLFSEQFGFLVDKEKRVAELQQARQQFVQLLQEVSREIVEEKELGVGLTPESIEAAMVRLKSEMDSTEDQRAKLLATLLKDAVAPKNDSPDVEGTDLIRDAGERLTESQIDSEKIFGALRNTETRISEVDEHKKLISDELCRLQRSRDAGEVFSALRITHCPACDREIERRPSEDGSCYLCGRPTQALNEEIRTSAQRLDFEVEQLQGELEEAEELLASLKQEEEALRQEAHKTSVKIQAIQQLLRPIRSAAASILPPEITAANIRLGRLQERMEQLRRIRKALDRRSKISEQIAQIQTEIASLQSQVDALNKAVDFESAADDLADGMNTYLNSIQAINPKSWTQDAVSVSLSDKGFKIRVGRGPWDTKLGGTLTLYFLISYHYSLLSLRLRRTSNYPGLCILDFPAELEDGSAVADNENFVLEPFIGLLRRPELQQGQVIAAGSAFENLADAHRIELKQIWK
jgi:hypothetical protein